MDLLSISFGTQELKITITDNQTQNFTAALVQFTDAAKIAPISNPIQVNLNLIRLTTEYVQAEVSEIAGLP